MKKVLIMGILVCLVLVSGCFLDKAEYCYYTFQDGTSAWCREITRMEAGGNFKCEDGTRYDDQINYKRSTDCEWRDRQ